VRVRVVYLTGEQVTVRPMVATDKECAAAWFAGPFPINATRAETWLAEEQVNAWERWAQHYAIVRLADDAVVGGATLSSDWRKGTLLLHMAPWLSDADTLRAEALRLLVRWVREDIELMTVVTHIAADEAETIAAAEAIGMTADGRLREHIARPGHRVDLLLYQALFAPWRETAQP
jgi:RimJ/RimL family protein N-acetyltransferase